MPIVVAEHREDGQLETGAGIGEDGGLLGPAVGGQVAGEQQHVRLAVELRDRLGGGVRAVGVAVDIGAGRDPDRVLVGGHRPARYPPPVGLKSGDPGKRSA